MLNVYLKVVLSALNPNHYNHTATLLLDHIKKTPTRTIH